MKAMFKYSDYSIVIYILNTTNIYIVVKIIKS